METQMRGDVLVRRGSTMHRIRTVAFLLLCLQNPVGGQSPPPASAPLPGTNKTNQEAPLSQTFVLVGAGDIAGCKALAGAEATAKLIEQIPGTVFAAGDLAYEHGSAAEFENCYGPAWGRFKSRTRPALGNHEYADAAASAYFHYFGALAGPAGKGYYS